MTMQPVDQTNRVVRVIAVVAAVLAVGLAIWAPIHLSNRNDPAPRAGAEAGVGDGVAPSTLAEATDLATSAAPTAPPEVQSGVKVGATVELEQGTGRFTVKLVSAKWVTKGGGDKGATPTSGNYLVLDVLLTATDGTVTSDWRDFSASDAAGAEHQPVPTTSGYEPYLSSKALAAGEKTRGRVVFDLAKGQTLVLLADPSGNPLATWNVPGSAAAAAAG